MQSTELLGQRVHVRNVVTCNGIIHGHAPVGNSGGDSDLVIIEVNDNCIGLDGAGPLTLRSLKVKYADAGFKYAGHSKHFLESCGRAYMVVLHARDPETRTVCAVNIWELDLSLMKWVRVKFLGGRAFFIGVQSCTWCWGDIGHGESRGIEGNSVYFFVPEHYGMTEALYHYNLEDCSLASLLPCPNLPSPSYSPTWVMSQHQRLVTFLVWDL